MRLFYASEVLKTTVHTQTIPTLQSTGTIYAVKNSLNFSEFETGRFRMINHEPTVDQMHNYIDYRVCGSLMTDRLRENVRNGSFFKFLI